MAVNKKIFPRLKRLFSTDVVIRNTGNQLKVIDSGRIQSYGNIETNNIIDRFSRVHKTSTQSVYNSALNYQTMRTQLYTDYEAMDSEPIVHSCLDILADECTLKNENGEVLQITSSDENIQRILYNLFYDVLNIEFNLWTWVRNMCKYGDFYLHLSIAEKFGVYNVTPLAAYDMIRTEGTNPENPSEVYYEWDPNATPNSINIGISNRKKFENYEMAHFRLLTDVNFLPYGLSYLEGARKTYKSYVLAKDAMLIHRIMRSADKRVFYIDVGNIPPAEVDTYMQKVVNKMKKTPYIDPQTGEYNLKFNIMNSLEDFYLPVRGQNSNTKIETTPGLQYTGMEDLLFIRDEMLSALRIPKEYYGFSDTGDGGGKSTLASKDIRFARTVERLQRIVISELTKIALVHLYTQGYSNESLTNFEISLTPPSIIYQQEQIALWKEKIGLAQDMINTNLFSSDFIYEKICQLSEEKYSEMRDLIVEDKKRTFRLNQLENEGNDPFKTGKSYGTPHDLAALYGKSYTSEDRNVPQGYDETKLGRPEEKYSDYGTQNSNLGRDPLGTGNNNMKEPANINLKAGFGNQISENKKKMIVENLMKKQIVFSGKHLLDENNIKGI